MKRQIAHLLAGVLLVSGIHGLAAATAAAKDKAPAKEKDKEIVVPKSLFETDPKKVIDPFFPKSVRWNPPPPKPKEVPKEAVVKHEAPPPPKDVYRNFELKGLVGVGDSRLVLISTGSRNYTLALHESRTVATPDGSKRLKVEGFTEKGVVIMVDGEKENKELKLPTGP